MVNGLFGEWFVIKVCLVGFLGFLVLFLSFVNKVIKMNFGLEL